MCRKSMSIIIFVCLLALGSVAFGAQLRWTATQGTSDWFTAGNWEDGNGTVPTIGDWARIEAKAPTPVLAADACCLALEINPWMWQYGPEDCNFTINAGNFDANCIALGGTSLQYGFPGWSDTPAVLNVNGGVVTINNSVPEAPDENSPPGASGGGRGLWIGGGSNTWHVNWGHVIVNGGDVNTPKIAIYNGDLTINGGTVYDTCDSFTQFVFRDTWARNMIYINGGTLKLAGKRAAELNNYINARRIIPEYTRGVFVGPNEVNNYPAGPNVTTLSSIYMPGVAWQSSPANLGTDVRYHLTGGLTLSWKAGDWIGEPNINEPNNGHYVFLGSAFNDVNNALVGPAGTGSSVYRGHIPDSVDDGNDPNIFIAESILAPATAYYVRVDEVNDLNDAENDPCYFKGIIWKFTTKSAAGSDPKPVAGAGLKLPLELKWMAGDWTYNEPNVHRVYFGTDSVALGLAGTGSGIVYRGTVSGPVYALSKLMEDRDSNGVPDFILAPNTTYYWRIDEKSPTGTYTAQTRFSSNFNTGTSVSVDDFQQYFDTDDLNDTWVEAPIVCSGYAGSGRIAMIREGRLGRWMQFTYDKSGGTGTSLRYFSEIELPYNDADWVPAVLASQPRLLEIMYRGAATNSADPDYDRMYVAVEDTGGDVSITLHPDPDAQKTGLWTNWAIAYKQLEVEPVTYDLVDLNHVDYLYLGAGFRCADDFFGGGEGNVMFDTIRVLSATCVPSEGPLADFDNNCIVNLRDLDILAGAWLDQDYDYDWIATQAVPHKAPILWYRFNEVGGTVVSDSGTGDTNDYAGSVNNYLIGTTWDIAGGRDGGGCIYLPDGQQSYVEAPVGSLYFHNPTEPSFTGELSFSIWINADLTANEYVVQWPGLIGTWNSQVTIETLELHCPSNLADGAATPQGQVNFIKRDNDGTGPDNGATSTTYLPISNFGGRWNHWVFIKTPTEMSTWCNGQEVNDVNTSEDIDIAQPLFTHPVGSFRVGTRGGNWAMWKGRLDDFQVYDYALSENEIHYLATDGTGLIHLEVASEANLKASNPDIVNFGDLAKMVDEWMTEKLWPQ